MDPIESLHGNSVGTGLVANAFLFPRMHNSFREVDVLVNVFVRVASAASGQFFAFVLAERMGSRAAAALTVTSIAILAGTLLIARLVEGISAAFTP